MAHRDDTGPAATMAAEGPALPGRVLSRQHWLDAVFVHWKVPPDRIASMLPPGTVPDVQDDSAWVGLICFRMRNLSLGRRLPVPWIGTFLETNVRTYTIDSSGRRGVYFLTLECDRLPAVLGARAVLGLNYRWSAQSFRREPLDDGERLSYSSRGRPRPRRASHDADAPRGASPAEPLRRTALTVEVGTVVTGTADAASAGAGSETLTPSPTELFLTARFGLHVPAHGGTLWMPNTHSAWPLRRARLVELRDELIAWCGLPGVVDDPPDSVLYSSGVQTCFGRPRRV